MMIFNERTWAIKDDELLLFRVAVAGELQSTQIQKAFHVRKIGAKVLFDPIHLSDIGYIEGAEK